ncbi:PEP-CTERM protein-sorting domain-containing protein [Nitrosomonas sp. Nm51]|uniref:PEP-CTERM sorting domain-containing protein n=1 Tax=Nitrosomonas sp. Nm51 TaxID=133720 RepID=UPI0008CF40C5|nr:PEP-CTERM sorting domain-containing protein [Nitrosomonas sp. Nm51]SEQ94458.1 PEP-CTERM protein-sorting domain-containing protein [Nitrosomonas sp. Nm51]
MSNRFNPLNQRRHSIFPFAPRLALVVTACLLVLAYTVSTATAALLPPDLKITTRTNALDTNAFANGLSFDEANSDAAIGNATHTGSMVQTIGGTSATTTIDDITITSGANPLEGMLTDTNDGWEIHSNVGGSYAGTSAETPENIYDLFFGLENQSAADSIQVTIMLDFDNRVNAGGADAFAASEIILYDGPSIATNELFFSDIESDTVVGNRFNSGNRTGNFGGPLNDTGIFQHVVTLNPGDIFDFHIFHLIEGGAFAAGSSYSASLDALISFDATNNTNPLPTPVTEPTILFLISAGVLGFMFKRKTKN